MAMWDLVGKAANQQSPAHRGALRESVSAYGNVTHDDDRKPWPTRRVDGDAGHDVIYVNAGRSRAGRGCGGGDRGRSALT